VIQLAKANKPAKTEDKDGGALASASGQSISKLAKREIDREPFVMAPDWSKSLRPEGLQGAGAQGGLSDSEEAITKVKRNVG
jgi:hypothetical protein